MSQLVRPGTRTCCLSAINDGRLAGKHWESVNFRELLRKTKAHLSFSSTFESFKPGGLSSPGATHDGAGSKNATGSASECMPGMESRPNSDDGDYATP